MKRKERERKKKAKEARKKLEMNQQKKQKKNWLMRMRKSKILYNLQHKLARNSAILYENAFIAKFRGIWQHSTKKTALAVKNAFF